MHMPGMTPKVQVPSKQCRNSGTDAVHQNLEIGARTCVRESHGVIFCTKIPMVEVTKPTKHHNTIFHMTNTSQRTSRAFPT